MCQFSAKRPLTLSLLIVLLTGCLSSSPLPRNESSLPSATSGAKAQIPTPTLTLHPLTPTLAPSATPLPTAETSSTPVVAAVKEPDYWPAQDWRTSSPEAQGMDSAQLVKLLEFIQKGDYNIHSLLIIRHATLVMETYFHPFGPGDRHELYSCTKSVTSALVGIAIDKGYIQGVGQKVVDFFPNRKIANLDDRKKAMTLEHLLTMTTGLEWIEGAGMEDSTSKMDLSPDLVQYVLDRPMAADPGKTFLYNNGASHLLSAILQQATGKTADEFAREYLFSRIGVKGWNWITDPQGVPLGYSELYLAPRDMARFGFLYLHNGEWDGKRIVSAAWVKASTQSYTPGSGSGYGYQWWTLDFGGLSPGGFGAEGTAGQFIIILPAQDLVVVFTGGLFENYKLPLDLVKLFILPVVRSPDPLPENAESFKRLDTLSQAIAHPAPKPVAPLPALASSINGKTYKIEANQGGWKTVSLRFRDNEAEITIFNQEMEKPVITMVGLDDIYRVSQSSDGTRLASKGFWKDDDTFLQIVQDLSQADRFEGEFFFFEDQVRITLRSASAGGYIMDMIGKQE